MLPKDNNYGAAGKFDGAGFSVGREGEANERIVRKGLMWVQQDKLFSRWKEIMLWSRSWKLTRTKEPHYLKDIQIKDVHFKALKLKQEKKIANTFIAWGFNSLCCEKRNF